MKFKIGPFTRVGPENVEYEKRDPYHKSLFFYFVYFQ